MVVVGHCVIPTNTGARNLMEDNGSEAVRGTHVTEIDLEEVPPEPEWPEGLTVRTLVPGGDERAVFEAVEDAFGDVWGRPRGTFERFAKMTEGEGLDPSLWFLATEGDEIAGAALCKTVAGEGWTSRGAAAVAAARARPGALAPRVRGVPQAWGSPGGAQRGRGERDGAPRLYGRAGMRQETVYVVYHWEFRPGGGFAPG